jgi:hypothetical protein
MPIKTSGNSTVQWGSPSAATISNVANVTANLSQASIETTAVNGTFKKFESGILEGTVDVELFYLESDHTIAPIKPGDSLANFGVVLDTNTSITCANALVEQSRVTIAPNSVVNVAFTVRLHNAAITVT